MLDPLWERAAQAVAYRLRGMLERDDALQVARLGAWRASQTFDPGSGSTEFSWCYRRAYGDVVDAIRARNGRHGEKVADVGYVPDDRAADWPASAEHLIRQLGADERERTMLRMLAADRPSVEIADALGVDASRVGQLKRRIRERSPGYAST